MTWLLYAKPGCGRRFKDLPRATVLSLKSAGAVGKKLDTYYELTHIAPVPLTAPVVSGTPAVGQVLTTTNGTWGGEPPPATFTYQWYSQASPAAPVEIAGATAKTFTITAAQAGSSLFCKVTATNAYGSYVTTGNSVGPVPAAGELGALAKPTNVALPTILGVAQVGEMLMVDPGEWSATPAAEFAYTWKADSVPIVGATADSYTLTADDVGKVITCTVVASNSEGSSQRTTVGTDAVLA